MEPDRSFDPSDYLPKTADLTAEEFDAIVDEELRSLPEDMLVGLDNVAIFVEDEHPVEGPNLLGIYVGHDQTTRGEYGYGELPDRIILYRTALIAQAGGGEELREQIRTTLVHEIGHFYGLDDEELHRLGWA